MRNNGENRKTRYFLLQILQWILFLLLILGGYLFETAGSYQKPLVLIPLALCIASHTGEIRAMLTGAVCGLLLDVACNKLIGSNAILLVLSCTLVSLLYRYLLRQKLFNMLLLVTICVFLQGFVDYLFYYAIWNHEDVTLILRHQILPCCLMTIGTSVFFYFLIRWIAERCGSRRIQKLEKMKIFPDAE